jgi:caffeoyl-CoA O-methyltransferase
VIDDRVREVLARLEEEDRLEREQGIAQIHRSRAVLPTTGRFLFALVAPQAGCEVLEIGGSRGTSSIWLGAAARILGGHVTSIERDPVKCEAWRRNVADAGLAGWVELVDGDAFEVIPARDDVFDVVFLDSEKEDYERLFELVRPRIEPGGLVVADNVVSHAVSLGEYSRRRQADPTLSSVTVPLDRGLEVTVILAPAAG